MFKNTSKASTSFIEAYYSYQNEDQFSKISISSNYYKIYYIFLL